MFGWSRETVALGLAEKRTGITCIGSQAGFSGAKRWEEKQPEVASSLVKLAESHSQQEQPKSISYASMGSKYDLERITSYY